MLLNQYTTVFYYSNLFVSHIILSTFPQKANHISFNSGKTIKHGLHFRINMCSGITTLQYFYLSLKGMSLLCACFEIIKDLPRFHQRQKFVGNLLESICCAEPLNPRENTGKHIINNWMCGTTAGLHECQCSFSTVCI